MAAINFYQNSKNFTHRKIKELTDDARHIQEHINYDEDTVILNSENGALEKMVFEFANVYNINVNMYDLQGKFLASSQKIYGNLPISIVKSVNEDDHVAKDSLLEDDLTLYSEYSVLKSHNKPAAILELQSVEGKYSSSSQTVVLLKQYALLLLFFIILSALISWLISRGLTKKIAEISEKLKETNIGEENTPLYYSDQDEIKPLVDSYNQMQVKIGEQTLELQKTERGEAWKEMARQMVHEINNPLTPLRLTVQNFHRKYKKHDPEDQLKVDELTKTVVHQIDLITAITQSFSDFAKMPVNNDQEIDMHEVIQSTVNIFPQEIVSFSSNCTTLYYKMDAMYLTRIITNVIKNGIQAIPSDRNKKIEVYLKEEKYRILISIADNGNGIPDDLKDKVFDQNFTTKSTGMGIGLSMVKKIVQDYQGKIWFESQPNFGTVFFIEFLK